MPLRVILAVVLAGLAPPAGASAQPGDPPFGPLTPADGATLPVDPGGIPASFSCPQFVIAGDGGPFSSFGFADDYGTSMSPSPALGPDGRLADSVAGTYGVGRPRADDPATCDTDLGNATAPTPQETPGRWYWQVWRPCDGCAGGFEVGPVRSFTLTADATVTLRAPRRAYTGHPFLAFAAIEGAPDGTPLSLQRRKGGRWRDVTTGAASLGEADIPTQCTDTGTIQPNISPVTAPPIRVAPDGRFLFVGGVRGVSVQVRGRIVRGRVEEGVARIVTSFCRGSITLEPRKR